MEETNERNPAELLRSIKSGILKQDVQVGTANITEQSIIDNMSNENIALRLLQSPDSRIAAAAKRIFSSNSSSASVIENGNSSSMQSSQNQPMSIKNSSPAHEKNGVSLGNKLLHQENDAIGILAATASEVDAQVGSIKNRKGHQEVQSLSASLTQRQDLPNLLNQGDIVSQASPSLPLGGAAASTNSNAKTMELQGTAKSFSCLNNMISKDRIHRRERNRMHARKTRQRKKEHMQNLQDEAESLKNEQIRLKLQINEKNTANILLVMCNNNSFSSDENQNSAIKMISPDAQVEHLMQRDPKDIPDSTRIMELPALVLPGQQRKRSCPDLKVPSNKRLQNCSENVNTVDNKTNGALSEYKTSLQNYNQELLEGIDYNLLCKDRSTCTPAELNQIRKERNRMHAKRTRDRKRIFMEEMKIIIEQLKDENRILNEYLNSLTNPPNRNLAPSNPPDSAHSNSDIASMGSSAKGNHSSPQPLMKNGALAATITTQNST